MASIKSFGYLAVNPCYNMAINAGDILMANTYGQYNGYATIPMLYYDYIRINSNHEFIARIQNFIHEEITYIGTARDFFKSVQATPLHESLPAEKIGQYAVIGFDTCHIYNNSTKDTYESVAQRVEKMTEIINKLLNI